VRSPGLGVGTESGRHMESMFLNATIGRDTWRRKGIDVNMSCLHQSWEKTYRNDRLIGNKLNTSLDTATCSAHALPSTTVM
jgi:hypothetical protein